MNGISRLTRVPEISLRLLGEFRLQCDEMPVTGLEGARLQSLLTYLVLHHDVPQSRTRLAFLLWPDSTEAQAHTNLRKLIYMLRNALPDADRCLVVERHTLLWRGDGFYTVDVLDFKAALARAEQAEQRMDETAERVALEEAVCLYQGELLPGCYDEWVLAERAYLSQLYLDALERLLCLWEQAGNYAVAIGFAHRLLREDPLQEASYCHLMRLYAASGNHAAAARTFQNCVRTLERELAVEPGPATRQAYQRLQQLNTLWNYTLVNRSGRGTGTLYAG
jgi:DNA-binding SARP family transcriptional activator